MSFLGIFLILLIAVIAVFIFFKRPNSQVGLSNVQVITSNDAYSFKFAKSYQNNAVWASAETGKWSAYLYDLATNKKINLNDKIVDQLPLGIYKNNVLLVEYSADRHNKIFNLYDISTDKKTSLNLNTPTMRADNTTQHPENFLNIELFETKLIYEEWNNDTENYSITSFDYISQNKKVLATCNQYAPCDPVVAKNKIAWIDYENNQYFIKVYDLQDGETKSIKPSGKNKFEAIQNFTKLSFNGKYLAWSDNRNCTKNIEGCTTNTDIYLYDLEKNIETRINRNKLNQEAPYLTSDKVFWADNRNGKLQNKSANDYQRDIYYSPLNKISEALVYNGGNGSHNTVFGEYNNKIIWVENNISGAGTGTIKVATMGQ